MAQQVKDVQEAKSRLLSATDQARMEAQGMVFGSPLKAVGAAFAVGVFIGAASGMRGVLAEAMRWVFTHSEPPTKHAKIEIKPPAEARPPRPKRGLALRIRRFREHRQAVRCAA